MSASCRRSFPFPPHRDACLRFDGTVHSSRGPWGLVVSHFLNSAFSDHSQTFDLPTSHRLPNSPQPIYYPLCVREPAGLSTHDVFARLSFAHLPCLTSRILLLPDPDLIKAHGTRLHNVYGGYGLGTLRTVFWALELNFCYLIPGTTIWTDAMTKTLCDTACSSCLIPSSHSWHLVPSDNIQIACST